MNQKKNKKDPMKIKSKILNFRLLIKMNYPSWDFRALISKNPINIDLAIQSLERENLSEIIRSYNYLIKTNQLDDIIYYIIFWGIVNGIAKYRHPINSLINLSCCPDLYESVIIGLENLIEKHPVLSYGDTYHHYNDDYCYENLNSVLDHFINLYDKNLI